MLAVEREHALGVKVIDLAFHDGGQSGLADNASWRGIKGHLPPANGGRSFGGLRQAGR
ncbi:hypothetical protein GCM10010840_25390 [Deinococcus aerolatus]|uniref:Uncharacterized protein n=1 Tax=Deinococcus aerolatus TaxID=522487 RepID=A0ABQ2GCQ6_9DEIO|nr:hypothetical protein GCM10010840_25390 [Deinococcus aerolatus]